MNEANINIFTNKARGDWIQLRTLIFLRWMAIAGQTLAVVFTTYVLEFKLNIGLCILVILSSVVFNIFAERLFSSNQRLPERLALVSLLFDLCQLVCLLFFAGGLNNPFALLLLAPVTISATALTLNSTVLLGLLAVGFTTLLKYFHLPLIDNEGKVIEMPALFLTGNWVALIIGFVFLSGYARRVAAESFSMSQALAATQMALDREHKLDILGGVVAAAAHEIGTPLATIKMAAAELVEELSESPDLQEDAKLIHMQTDRLKDILQDMGNTGKDDLLLKSAPFITVIQEAAQPHEARGKTINFLVNGKPVELGLKSMPNFPRLPEIIHGLRNLLQNAVDFADANVFVNISWNEEVFEVNVVDDGPGFPAEYLSRLGDPFLRKTGMFNTELRENYEGMGLGLFIAKTLLERTGAVLIFSNGSEVFSKSGANVSVKWNTKDIKEITSSYGPNKKFEI